MSAMEICVRSRCATRSSRAVTSACFERRARGSSDGADSSPFLVMWLLVVGLVPSKDPTAGAVGRHAATTVGQRPSYRSLSLASERGAGDAGRDPLDVEE